MSRFSNTTVIIAAGALVLSLSFGVRSVFGVMLDPISNTFGWPREVFSLTMAIGMVIMGVGQPFFGWIADRVGDRAALWLGFALYLVGMLAMVHGQSQLVMHSGGGVLVGLGISGTGFGIILPVVGRAVPEVRRSQAMAMTAAFGSIGQMTLPAVAGALVDDWGWQVAMLVMTGLLLPIALCIPFLKADVPAENRTASEHLATAALLRRAFGHRSYTLLVMGFFVCGFHVAFISAHFPAYVAEMCGTPENPATELGAWTLSIVGLANFVGTMIVGQLGARLPKPYILATIYALRAAVIMIFIMTPVTPTSVILFSFVIGLLWLSTVPITSALVATMFGPRYIATLYGIVFLSHQVGSFTGVYLGGRAYDLFGNYDMIWYAAIGLGIFSAIVHLPIRDRAWQEQPA